MPHRVHQDLRPCSRHPVQACLLELLQNRLGLKAGEPLQPQDLLGAEGVYAQVGEAALEVAEEVQVPLQGKLGVHPALHEDPLPPHLVEFLNLLGDLLVTQGVGVLLPLGAVEGAEGAGHGADVGVVDVAVNEEGDHLGVGLPQAHLVGGGGELGEGKVKEG